MELAEIKGIGTLRNLPRLLAQLVQIIAFEMDEQKLASFIAAIIIYFIVLGFLTGYFATRLFVQRVIRIADLTSIGEESGTIVEHQETMTVRNTSLPVVGQADDSKKSDEKD
jgi:hypothetical protein